MCPTGGRLASLEENSGVLSRRQSTLRLTTSETKPKRRAGVPTVCRRNEARKFDAACPESRHVGALYVCGESASDRRAQAETYELLNLSVASVPSKCRFWQNTPPVKTKYSPKFPRSRRLAQYAYERRKTITPAFARVYLISLDVLGCPWKGSWRREWDSNPRYSLKYTRFPSVRLKPLGHLSVSVPTV